MFSRDRGQQIRITLTKKLSGERSLPFNSVSFLVPSLVKHLKVKMRKTVILLLLYAGVKLGLSTLGKKGSL
jgi:hypothetical protein